MNSRNQSLDVLRGRSARAAEAFESIALATCPLLIFLAFGLWLTMFGGYSHGHSDFSHLYAAGYLVRSAPHELYNLHTLWNIEQQVTPYTHVMQFIRPAYAALMFAPFSYLSLHAAYCTWLAINVLCLVATGLLLRTAVPPQLFAALAMAYLPVSIALLNGQDSILLLLLLAGGLVALEHDHDALCGGLLGLGLFKFQLVIPIAVLFLFWRRWRVLGGFAAIGSILFALSVAVAGFSGTLQLVQLLRTTPTHVYFQMMAGLHPVCLVLSNQWNVFLTVLTSALVIWFTVRGGREQSSQDQLLMAITTSGLVGFYFNIHDWAILLLPMLIVFRSSRSWLAMPLLIAPSLLIFTWSLAWLATFPMLFLLFGTVPFSASYPGTERRLILMPWS